MSLDGSVGILKGNVTVSGDAHIGGIAIEQIRRILLTRLKLFPFCFPILALRNLLVLFIRSMLIRTSLLRILCFPIKGKISCTVQLFGTEYGYRVDGLDN